MSKSVFYAGGNNTPVNTEQVAKIFIEYLKNSTKSDRLEFVKIIRNNIVYDRFLEMQKNIARLPQD